MVNTSGVLLAPLGGAAGWTGQTVFTHSTSLHTLPPHPCTSSSPVFDYLADTLIGLVTLTSG